MPDYRGAHGALYTIEGVSTRECPASRIDEGARADVERFVRGKRMKDAAGTAAWGADLAGWPAREVELWDLLEIEHQRTDHAKWEAEQAARG